MWKWLHPLANPEVSFRWSSILLPWFTGISIILLLIGTGWGLLISPPDYQQGDSVRIFYVHVPAAMLSMGAYLAMAISAFIGLVWQYKQSDAAIAAIAPIGAAFTAVALWTGAAWGKPMWGTWWVWDARLTSELILLFLYFGVMALQNAFDDRASGGKAAAILAIVGVINLPIIHYSVEWWNTLHQGATVLKLEKPSITANMAIPFLFNVFGFGFMFGALVLYRFKTELLISNSSRPWVKKLVSELEVR